MRGSGTYLYYMTMARIRAPFGGEIISPKNTRQTNTIDNVKAKMEKRHWSRPTLARCPVFC
jgi:hypothetical protein